MRKAAKRLRYAAETAVPVHGKDAARLVKRAMAIQTSLGEHQDSVVARQGLREVAMRAYLDGDNTFTYGRLHGLEDLKAADSLATFERAWVRLERAARRYPKP